MSIFPLDFAAIEEYTLIGPGSFSGVTYAFKLEMCGDNSIKGRSKSNERKNNSKSKGELVKDHVFSDSHPHHLEQLGGSPAKSP